MYATKEISNTTYTYKINNNTNNAFSDTGLYLKSNQYFRCFTMSDNEINQKFSKLLKWNSVCKYDSIIKRLLVLLLISCAFIYSCKHIGQTQGQLLFSSETTINNIKLNDKFAEKGYLIEKKQRENSN